MCVQVLNAWSRYSIAISVPAAADRAPVVCPPLGDVSLVAIRPLSGDSVALAKGDCGRATL